MNKALLVIDVQESFRQLPSWETISNPDIVEAAGRLVAHARLNGDHVVWVLHSEAGSGDVFDPALGHVRLMDGLKPLDHDTVVTKTSHNAFTTTNLQQILTSMGIHEVVVSGIRTEQCCETTARIASDLGYAVTFVTDATATSPLEHPRAPKGRSVAEILADPLTLTCSDVITRTEYALAGRFATVTSVDAYTGDDSRAADAPPA